MNFTFTSPSHGACVVKLWASGRYGFSLPKKVEIATPGGAVVAFQYVNQKLGAKAELSNRDIVRIAVAAFLDGAATAGTPLELDPERAPYLGPLTPLRLGLPRAPMRVRPGKSHARARAEEALDPA